jgi:hypothetical protein
VAIVRRRRGDLVTRLRFRAAVDFASVERTREWDSGRSGVAHERGGSESFTVFQQLPLGGNKGHDQVGGQELILPCRNRN